MTACSVSNSTNRGVNINQPYYYDYNFFSSVKETNFTQTKRPLYIQSRKAEIAFNRFERNMCGSDSDCFTVQAISYQSLYCYGKIANPKYLLR